MLYAFLAVPIENDFSSHHLLRLELDPEVRPERKVADSAVHGLSLLTGSSSKWGTKLCDELVDLDKGDILANPDTTAHSERCKEPAPLLDGFFIIRRAGQLPLNHELLSTVAEDLLLAIQCTWTNTRIQALR